MIFSCRIESACRLDFCYDLFDRSARLQGWHTKLPQSFFVPRNDEDVGGMDLPDLQLSHLHPVGSRLLPSRLPHEFFIRELLLGRTCCTASVCPVVPLPHFPVCPGFAALWPPVYPETTDSIPGWLSNENFTDTPETTSCKCSNFFYHVFLPYSCSGFNETSSPKMRILIMTPGTCACQSTESRFTGSRGILTRYCASLRWFHR